MNMQIQKKKLMEDKKMTHIMKLFEFDDFLWICMTLMIFFTEFYEFLVMFMNFMNSMLPRTAPFYSLWSFYGLYTGLFVFDSMVLFF